MPHVIRPWHDKANSALQIKKRASKNERSTITGERLRIKNMKIISAGGKRHQDQTAYLTVGPITRQELAIR
ncbi:hypothetical protein GP2143_02419 [marine gamma proteobacterium HTCC2143]|uniref:Uncharacterized protein n=1 Tax=marine gamma proteobacterium HTCC2143 TaxID=247633 RepID=A0YEA5_9GAMM|nr:hypothetical protein GP2143_02419 [marine gamma proteobacterium HTCC2143]